MADDVLLTLSDLSVTFGTGPRTVHAVDHVDLEIHRGETLGLVGESGSGKTTLALSLLGILPPSARVSGHARLGDIDLAALSGDGWRRVRWTQVAMVFQKSLSALSPVHRVGKQMSDVLMVHRRDMNARGRKEYTQSLLQLVGLHPDVWNAYPHELSGGMMQRVSIALSLIHRPRLLILDEATTALDVVTQAQILAEIRRLQRELGLTVVIITHDMAVVSEVANRVAVMYAGRLCEVGRVEAVVDTPIHPYTAALRSAIPRLDVPRGSLHGIPGSLPDLTAPPSGCIFADRCTYAREHCRDARPELRAVSEDQLAACHYPLTRDASWRRATVPCRRIER
jgi:peptide/nickel transport system ATP-binding protein